MTKKLQFCVCKNVRTLFTIKGVRNGTPEKALYVATSNVGPDTTRLVIRRWTEVPKSRRLRVDCMPWSLSYIVEEWESNDHVVELRAIINTFSSSYVIYDHVTFDLQQILYTRSRIFQLQSLSIEFIKSVAYQALKGLAFLHGRNIQHRKLKSGSILITEDGVVKIGDLDSAWCPSGINSIIGSASYRRASIVVPLWNMAPEILLQYKFDSVTLNKEADVWALGCILLEMAYHKHRPVFQRSNQKTSPMEFLVAEDVIYVVKAMTMLLGTPEVTDFTVDKIPELVQILKAEGQHTSKQPNKLQDWCSKHLSNCPPAYELLRGLLTYAPWKRATAEDAVKDPWFQDLQSGPLPNVLDYLSMDRPSERDWLAAEPRSPESIRKQQTEGAFSATARIEGMPLHFELTYILTIEKELEAKRRARKRSLQAQVPSKGIKREREDTYVAAQPTSKRRNSVKTMKAQDSSSPGVAVDA